MATTYTFTIYSIKFSIETKVNFNFLDGKTADGTLEKIYAMCDASGNIEFDSYIDAMSACKHIVELYGPSVETLMIKKTTQKTETMRATFKA